MDINLNDIILTPIENSVKRLKISDDEYFSKKYRNYISNSRLKYINPDQEGCPSLYKDGIKQETTRSLALGSAIHECFLQSEEFSLAPDLNKPSAKLGFVCDEIIKNRKSGQTIYDAIVNACLTVDYYATNIANNHKRIRQIIEKGLCYYLKSKTINPEKQIILSSRDREICVNCLNALNSNKTITNLIRPVDLFGDPVDSFNEDALFIDVKCTYGKKSTVLRLKMKADNWTINKDNKTVVLNDLKTTSKPLGFFMQDYGSFVKFHYARQFGMYMWMLKHLCKKEFNTNNTWRYLANVIVVETSCENKAGLFRVSLNIIKEGEKEFIRLLKQVGYCEINGYNDSIKFIE